MSEEKMERDVRDLSIDDTDLDTELTKQAGLFFYVAEKSVVAEGKYRDYKAQVERLEAVLSGKAREAISKETDPASGKPLKPTEKMVADRVILDETFKKASAYLNQLYIEKELMRALRESWYMRKDMLIQVAVKQRSELESLASSTVKGTEMELVA